MANCISVTQITEKAELEVTHKDHGVQLLALHGTSPRSQPVPESIVQILLELRQAWCSDHFSGELTIVKS